MFKADAMTLRLRQRSGKEEYPRFDGGAFHGQTSSDDEENRLRLEFSMEAREVCDRISDLRSFLVETRAAYMHLCDNIRPGLQVMSDGQRNLIDRKAGSLFNFYAQQLVRMRHRWLRNEPPRTQRQHHIANILEMLSVYHRSVHQILLQQQQYRAIYDMETYRLVRLGSEKDYVTVRLPDLSKDMGANILNTIAKTTGGRDGGDGGDGGDDSDHSERSQWYRGSNAARPVSDSESEGESGDGRAFCPQDEVQSSPNSALGDGSARDCASAFFHSDDEELGSDEDHPRQQLSEDQIQMMETENAQLYNEMQGLTEEVEVIEKNVTDIAKLQNVFTEKVSGKLSSILSNVNADLLSDADLPACSL